MDVLILVLVILAIWSFAYWINNNRGDWSALFLAVVSVILIIGTCIYF